MSIRAIYENGVFGPLEELSIEQGTEVTIDVYPIEGRKESSGKRQSVKDFVAYGMWRDRTDSRLTARLQLDRDSFVPDGIHCLHYSRHGSFIGKAGGHLGTIDGDDVNVGD